MTRRVDIFCEKMIGILACVLLLICVITSCTSRDEGPEVDETWVTLSISAGTDPMATRADGNSNDNKDIRVNDLTVYVFDANGQVIGSAFSEPNNITNNSSQVDVKARKAQNCTLVVVANAKALSGTMPFAGVSTLNDFKQKCLDFTDAATLQGKNCLLMMGGKFGDFDTSCGSLTINLQRLASRLDFNITVKEDQSTSLPIVVDSYQLCQAPMSAYYVPADWNNITLPNNTLDDYAEVNTSINSWDANPATTYTEYVYANPATDASTATYLLIKAHSQASDTDPRKVWESEFKVYLQGATKTGETTPLADYKLLPNYHYTINITIQGSIKENNGVIATYNAYPYYSVTGLDSWTDDTNYNLDLK